MCAACAHANNTYYYCTVDDTCRSTPVDTKSCEQGLLACLAYKTNDLGVKEIPPFTLVRSSFNYTVTPQNAVKFAISNQDSKRKGWFKLMLKNGQQVDPDDVYPDSADVDTTSLVDIRDQILESKPDGIYIKYFDQNTGNFKTEFVYSKAGKSYLKPLNTRFIWVYAIGNSTTVSVLYGNYKGALLGYALGAFKVAAIVLSVINLI